MLSRYAAGELDDDDFRRVDSHVVACVDCTDRMNAFESKSDAELRSLLQTELGDPTSFHSARYDRLLAKLQAIPEVSSTNALAAGESSNWHVHELIGSQLGDFRIDRLLGQGGMGVVYEARQLSLGRRVALKVLPRQMLARSRVKDRFEREVKVVASLHHTNIVPVFGFGEQDGWFYYVMQYIAGRPLSRVIAERREGPRARTAVSEECDATDHHWRCVARVGAQVGWALAHAHEHGVLHRDIKPSNLLLEDSGVVWVTDFGLAKCDQHPDLTETREVLGTLRYLPPESLEGDADEWGDIYSLGLTLYELATGRPALGEVNRYRLLRSITAFEIERLDSAAPGIPRDLATIIHKSMERDAKLRYSSARELVDDLQRFLDNEPIRARRASTAERLTRWVRKNRALTVSLAATLVTVIVALTISIGATIYFYQAERDKTALAAELQKSLEEEARQRQQAETIVRYLEAIFEPAELIAERPNVTVREALERATDKLDPREITDPHTRYKLYEVYGRAYYSSGQYEPAIEMYELAIESLKVPNERITPELLATKAALAETLARSGRLVEAVELGDEVAESLADRLGEDHIDTINQRLWVVLNRDDTETLAKLVVRVHPRVAVTNDAIGDISDAHRSAIEHLGLAYLKLKEYQKAEQLYAGFIEQARREVDTRSQEAVLTLLKAAWLFRASGRFEQAYEFDQDAVEIGELRLGEFHNATLWAMDMLWRIYQETGGLEQAKRVADRMMPLCRAKLGSEHDEVARLETRYDVLVGRLAEARVAE